MPKRAAPDSPAELDNAKISCRADFQEIAARYHRDQLVLIEGGGAANWSFAELAAAWADAPAWVAAEWQVEAGGAKLTPEHVMPRLQAGGLVHPQGQWYVSTVLQDDDGQIIETHSISAGLDYPGVGPEHSWLKDIGRVNYVAVDDGEALASFHRVTRTEGIMPALETAHALAYAEKLAATMRPDQHIVVNLSGRGDKDILTVARLDGIEL